MTAPPASAGTAASPAVISFPAGTNEKEHTLPPTVPARRSESFRFLENNLMEIDFSGKVFIKQGTIYLVDRTHMGGFSAAGNHVVQSLVTALPGGVWGAPAYFNGSIYYGGVGDAAK